MKTRGLASEKEKLSLIVKHLAKDCTSLEELSKNLTKHSLEPYYRGGKLAGLWLGNRKFRLTTLGIGKEHLKSLTLEQKRLNQLQRDTNTKNKDLQR